MTATTHLATGDRIRFAEEPKRPYLVRATSENFAVCTRQAPFKPRGVLLYAVIDYRQNIRGPVNVIGQGWNVTTAEECIELVRLLEAGEWEVSHRNRLPLDFTLA